MKLLLSICVGLAFYATAMTNAQANLSGVKSKISDALYDCESHNSKRTLRCLINEIDSIEERQYSKASSRNNNRLICIIDTNYYDDDGDGWGWIPETRESCVVIGQKDIRRRAAQLDNAVGIYKSLKWIKQVKTCYQGHSNFNDHAFNSRHDRRNRHGRRTGNNKRRDRVSERMIDCVEDKVESNHRPTRRSRR